MTDNQPTIPPCTPHSGWLQTTLPEARPVPSLPELARAFLSVGLFAFGGQGGLLALLNRDFVERRGWLDEKDVTEAFTYVQLLPGAVVVQVVAYLGCRLRGWGGAGVATVCFLLPSVTAMLALAMAYRRMALIAGVPAILNGLTAAVVGLIAFAAYKQARKTVKNTLDAIIVVVVCAASVWRHVNPAVLVVAAGLVGMAREAARRQTATDSGSANGKGSAG